MLLGYVKGHGHAVLLDENNTIHLVDVEEPGNGVVASGMEELLECISTWNYEFIQDSEVVGEQREQVLKDMEMIDGLLGGSRAGIPLGNPTVKELIAILSEYSARDCAPRPLELSTHSGGIERSRRWH